MHKEMEGNFAILEGNFDWIPRKKCIFLAMFVQLPQKRVSKYAVVP